MEYSEDDKKMIVYIDFRDPIIELSMGYITHWEPPYEKLDISIEDKQRIYHNIYEYIRENFGQEHIELKEENK